MANIARISEDSVSASTWPLQSSEVWELELVLSPLVPGSLNVQAAVASGPGLAGTLQAFKATGPDGRNNRQEPSAYTEDVLPTLQPKQCFEDLLDLCKAFSLTNI